MANYKYLKDHDGVDREDTILRVADNAYIPNDSRNKDWVSYQEWLALGNTPDAA